MAICQKCQLENEEGATRCQKCGDPMPVVSSPSISEVPSVPAPMSKAFRSEVGLLLGRSIAESESAEKILAEVIAHFKDSDRQVQPTTPPSPVAPVSPPTPEASHAPPPQPPLPHTELFNAIANKLERYIQPGEKPTDILSELEAKLKTVVPAANHVEFPTFASKLLTFLPKNLRWIVAMALPLVLGGGSGYYMKPNPQKVVTPVQSVVKPADDQISRLNADLAAKSAEIGQLSKDNSELQSKLNLQKKTHEGQLAESHKKTVLLENNLGVTKKMVASLLPFARQGFIRWQGPGGGDLRFLPVPTRGDITGGKFPDPFVGSDCRIVEVAGDVNDPKSLSNKPCSQTISIKGGRDKKVVVAWRQGAGN